MKILSGFLVLFGSSLIDFFFVSQAFAISDKESSSYVVEHGYIGEDNGGMVYISEDANIIEVEDSGEVKFGYIVKSASGGQFNHSATIHLPRNVKVKGDRPEYVENEAERSLLYYPEISCPGYCFVKLRWEKGDPLGNYALEMNINGKKFMVVNFVVKMKK